MSIDDNPHTDWCGDECDFESEGVHTSSPAVAFKGGPMDDPETDRHVDLAPSVGLRRFDDGTADVQITINPWTRMNHRGDWGVHGELMGLLAAVPMSVTRARYLAKLLTEAADEADRINDATPSNVTVLDFGGES